MDLQAARTAMIDSQVRPNDVTDRRVIAAMAAVPREAFLPAAKVSLAYADVAPETGPGRHLMAARDFAKLTNSAAIKETDRVLDIAPGAGYSSAVLARIAGSVVALEQDEAAAKTVRDTLSKVGVSSVEVISGALKAGVPAKAPFDVIFVNGAVEDVPKAWVDQLAEDGRLVVVVFEGLVRRARVYTRSGGKTAWRTPFESAAPSLPGFERAEEFRL
ncbi:MAG: protein-L-isoaspartate O-methyltransferase [Hyphomonadaceae bacterium]|nr:protein-L-isoaspartate O-methyltransferase [Hyphomonadaceae bacterium]